MKKIILLGLGLIAWAVLIFIGVGLLLAANNVKACDEVYFKVGAGYKFAELEAIEVDGVEYKFDPISPYSARIELGVQKGRWTYGVSHHSQWFQGFPANGSGEPNKSEVFVDYKFQIWGL